jgi:3-oxoacyl-[acyl-carrier protein] reductase
VETATLRSRMPAAQLQAVAAQVPLGRVGAPADVAEAVVFLASDASSWITGTTLDITGGMTL